MRTLSVLHSDLLIAENIPEYVRQFPRWELTTASTVGGGTRPFYWALGGTGPRVIPDTWTQSEIDQFHSVWSEMSLVSAQLEEQEYEDIIALLGRRSIIRTPEVVEVG